METMKSEVRYSGSDARDEGRQAPSGGNHWRRARGGGSTGPTTLLLTGSGETGGLTASTNRWWTRLAARALASSLDRQLAEGASPESNRLLAARAQVLVTPAMRQTHADDLDRVLARATTPPVPRTPRASVNRQALVACQASMADVRERLLGRSPVPARGVATVGCLLRDGTGPLYNRHLPALRLDAVLTRIIGELDPLSADAPW
jgi:hypothetical protein